MKSNGCSCTTTTEACRTTAGERPRYFPRQLVTAEDMMLEQEYFRNRMRLHNRLLHGWGVVCGLGVAPVPKKDGSPGWEPWKVKVCMGDALDPYGNEIMVPGEVEIDLRQDSVSGSSVDPCGAMADVWCSEVWLPRSQEAKLYLAIKYAEIPTRPVRIQPAGCGCDDTACEFSRFRDGYIVKVLTEAEYLEFAPGHHPALSDWRELFKKDLPRDPNPACCSCQEKPWIVLAWIQLRDGEIISIDNCGPRRLVAALGCFYWSCAKLTITSVSDSASAPSGFECGGDGPVLPLSRDLPNTVFIFGENFQPGQGFRVDFGPGITVQVDEMGFSSTMFSVTATVESGADGSPRDVVVINPDCSTAICRGAIQVEAAAAFRRQEPPRMREAPVEEAKVAEAKPQPKRRRRPEA